MCIISDELLASCVKCHNYYAILSQNCEILWDIQYNALIPILIISSILYFFRFSFGVRGWGSSKGTDTSHQCDPGSIPRLGVI